MCDSQGAVKTSPPSTSLIRIRRVLPLDEMHESWLVKQRKHAVEIVKVVCEKGEGFLFRRQRPENWTLEEVIEDLGLPVGPLVVIDRDLRNSVRKRLVPSLCVDPLNALW